MGCGRGKWRNAGLAGFRRAGATVGLAWDAGSGAVLAGVDGASPLVPLFPDSVAPGPVIGAGLFPALSGKGGCRVRWNLGQRPFRHAPPPGLLPFIDAALGQVDRMRASALTSLCDAGRAAQCDQPLTVCGRVRAWGVLQGGADLVEGRDGDAVPCPVSLPCPPCEYVFASPPTNANANATTTIGPATTTTTTHLRRSPAFPLFVLGR